MSIQHFYSQTVADGTATSVVRPSDWNSVHNQVLNMGGNTSGTSQISGADIIWAGGNNITLSANGSTVTIVGPATVAQTVQTQASGNIVGAGFTSTTTAGTAVVATHNSAGLSMGIPAYITTATQSVQTQASGNLAGIGYTSTTQAGSTVGATHNTAGLSMAWPPFITTATQSVQTQASGNIVGVGFTSTTTAGTAIVATHNSQGLSMGVPAYLTTFAAQTNQTIASGNIAGVGTTFGGTNVSGSMTLNSNGLALSLSAGAGGVINQTGPNFAVAGSTVTSGTVLFSNANGVSWGIAGQTLTASVAAGGAGGATINDYEIFPLGNNTSFSSYSQNALHFQRIMPMNNVSMTAIEMLISMSSVTSSVSHSVGHTMSYGIYTKGTGASTSQMQSMATSSFFIQASYSSNLSGGYTVGQGTNSFTSSSAGTVFGSVLSGQKILALPFSTSLAAGGDYFLCFAQSSASVGNTGAIRMSHVVQTIASNGSWGQLDTGGARISNSSYSNEPFMVSYSATSGAWATTLAKSDMRNNANSINQMYALLEA